MGLNLEDLRMGIMGLTPEFGSFCLQACTACLEKSNHTSGIMLPLAGSKQSNFTLNWTSSVNEQIRRNWSDSDEATEYGATAVAILLSKEISMHNCIERSSKGLGFDYWLGDEDSLGVFQRKARLEISGIFKESPSNTVESRAKQKGARVKKSNFLNMNAHICIMEFSNPKCIYSIV
jgi:hypothetical protein